MRLTLLLCLAACTSAGPHHQDVAHINRFNDTDHDHKEVDHQELSSPTKGIIRDLVNGLEDVLEEYGVDKFTLR